MFYIIYISETPLHWAAINDSIEAAKLLLEKGADINAQTENIFLLLF